MRIRDALLSARSYLTILIGFLLGFAIVVWVGKTNARARREQRRDDVEPGFSAAPSPARADL